MNGIRGERQSARGFTLVEIIAACLLLSIGLLAVLAAVQAARETQQRALYLSIGRNIAQSKIEKARSMSIDNISSLAGTTQDSSLPAGNSVTISVSRYPDASQIHLYRVTVTVSWPEQKGTRRLTYETLIARK
jgi:prepilin-type N-terminal cleavage/methylation domain-containing protein